MILGSELYFLHRSDWLLIAIYNDHSLLQLFTATTNNVTPFDQQNTRYVALLALFLL
jgi:hypothetical protein